MLKFLKMNVFHRQSIERFTRMLEDDVDDLNINNDLWFVGRFD